MGPGWSRKANSLGGATPGGYDGSGSTDRWGQRADTLRTVDTTTRFLELMARPESQIPTEEAALLIAAHARPRIDVDRELMAIDELATGCGTGLDGVVAHLFGELGYRGNERAYYDPANSYLDLVVATRRGIPITLSVLTVAVARRSGVDLCGVGMPGHFLVGVTDDPDTFVDPFAGGRVLDTTGCRRVFQALHGPDAQFSSDMLQPTGPRLIVARMLNNLLAIFSTRRDHRSRLWVARLRAGLPGASLEDRAEVAAALSATGAFGAAADHLSHLSEVATGEIAVSYRQTAARLRSRLN